MRHPRKIKCSNCGSEPRADELVCETCWTPGWIWLCDRHNLLTADVRGCEQCGYLFLARRFYEPVELATILAANWDQAREHVRLVSVERWAADGLGNDLLAARLNHFNGNAATYPDAALAALVATLNPAFGLRWRGKEFHRTDFVTSGEPKPFANSGVLKEIIQSGLPGRIGDLPACRWLGVIREQCLARCKLLGLTEVDAATPLQCWWLLADLESLRQAAARVKEQYVSAYNTQLALLFNKAALTDLEALALATADRDQLLTAANAWTSLVSGAIPKLRDVERKVRQRPITLNDLTAAQRELDEVLSSLRARREQLRPRQPCLPDSPQVLEIVKGIRMDLLQALKTHDQIQAQVAKVRELVDRGFIRRAMAEAAEMRKLVAEFSDLNLDFVMDANLRHQRRLLNLVSGSILLGVGIILTLMIFKVFNHATTSLP